MSSSRGSGSGHRGGSSGHGGGSSSHRGESSSRGQESRRRSQGSSASRHGSGTGGQESRRDSQGSSSRRHGSGTGGQESRRDSQGSSSRRHGSNTGGQASQAHGGASSSTSRATSTRWTSEDDTTLIQIVRTFGNGTIHWDSVATATGRSASACKVRWTEKVDPSLYANAPAQRWRAPGEIQRLLNLVNSGQYATPGGGISWTSVKRAFGWGSATELRDTYHKNS